MSNAIGFVVMGGMIVVGSAISFVKWHAQKACKDVKMVRGLMELTGCSLRVANSAKDTVRKFEAEYMDAGVLTAAVYAELMAFAIQFCKENANA